MLRRCLVLTALATLAACGSGSTSSSSGPAASAQAGNSLTFTGALTGSTGATHGTGLFCDPPPPDGTVLNVEFTAALGSTTYQFSINVDPYQGPKSYDLGLAAPGTFNFGIPVVTTSSGGNSSTVTTAAYTSLTGTLTIAAGGKSGDVDADLTTGEVITNASTPSAHVKGHWSCA